MRYWFDTEFIEDGKTIDLISIGIVAESGHMLYLENRECNTNGASPWVIENVLPHLIGGSVLLDRVQMQTAIRNFVEDGGGKPEFWAYYGAYDWVALCQLFGTMMDLPKGWPMYCRDVKQLCDALGNPKLPKQGKGEHHALADAKWTKDAYHYLMEIYAPTLAWVDGEYDPGTRKPKRCRHNWANCALPDEHGMYCTRCGIPRSVGVQ